MNLVNPLYLFFRSLVASLYLLVLDEKCRHLAKQVQILENEKETFQSNQVGFRRLKQN